MRRIALLSLVAFTACNFTPVVTGHVAYRLPVGADPTAAAGEPCWKECISIANEERRFQCLASCPGVQIVRRRCEAGDVAPNRCVDRTMTRASYQPIGVALLVIAGLAVLGSIFAYELLHRPPEP